MNLQIKKREKIMLAAAVVVVLYFAADFLFIRPLDKQIKERREHLKQVEEKMAAAVNTIPELNSLRLRVKEKIDFLSGAKDKITGREQIRIFLNQLAQESNRLKLEIKAMSFSPEGETAGGKAGKPAAPEEKKEGADPGVRFKKVTASVNLTGPYEGVREYLAKMEQLPLFMELDHIQIQGDKDGLPRVQLTFRPGFLMRADEKL
ncbi:MAG: type II secretion system protein M [Desulfobacterota bacterium]|jgi:Tfp pilus assembly protein PilO|nr:type II secretion system protein M [Thermodesulfobacteriota bacterium]